MRWEKIFLVFLVLALAAVVMGSTCRQGGSSSSDDESDDDAADDDDSADDDAADDDAADDDAADDDSADDDTSDDDSADDDAADDDTDCPDLQNLGSTVGKTAFDFTLKDSAGNPVELYSMVGQVVLVNFAAGW